jgi:hypothetical protein
MSRNTRISSISVVLVLTVSTVLSALRARPTTQDVITWDATIEGASGGGHRGPWQQNESKYDYVDDATVALDAEGDAAVAWVDQRQKDVLFQIYDRYGKPRHNEPVNISRSPAIFSWLPRIVLSRPNHVFVLWQEIVFSGGSHGGEIFFARSRDGGASFSEPLNLSNSINGDGKGRTNKDSWHNGSLDLAIGIDGTLYAAWTEYDGPLWVSRSNDDGESFSKPMRLAGGGEAKPARAPALAVGSDNVIYLAWTVGEDDRADIQLSKSTDGARTFSEPVTVEKTNGYSDAPKVAVDRKGTVHIVYCDSSGGSSDCYHVRYARSRNGGQTFETGREVSRPDPPGIECGSFPALSLDAEDNIYVLWELYPKAREQPRGLAIACSRDTGQTFTAPAVVPQSSDPAGGWNGSNQGRLMRKLAVNSAGEISVVNSSFKQGAKSRVWLMRGQLKKSENRE